MLLLLRQYPSGNELNGRHTKQEKKEGRVFVLSNGVDGPSTSSRPLLFGNWRARDNLYALVSDRFHNDVAEVQEKEEDEGWTNV